MSAPATKKMPLNLESDTLNAFKSDFNKMLRKLLRMMETQEAEEGTLTAKINVKLTHGEARDFEANGYDGKREIVTPKFDHKVGISMQFKDEKTGTLGGNYEMRFDKELNAYVMVQIDNGQINMFDQPKEEEEPEEPETPEVIEAEGSVIGAPALPEAATVEEPADVIDGEFTEVEESDDEEAKDAWDAVSSHAGEDLRIQGSGGLYSVRTAKGGNIVLTSAGSAKSHLRVAPEVLAKHVGHECICRGDTYGDSILRCTVKCISCNENLWIMDNPYEEFNYEYEKPEE